MTNIPEIPLYYVVVSGCATVVLASALAYVLVVGGKKQQDSVVEENNVPLIKIDQSQYPGGALSIYYGTQTGTSESFARQLEREGPDHGFFVHVVDLEDIVVEDIVDDARKDEETGRAKAVFLTATYGEGEASDNATQFVNAMKEKACTDIFFEDMQSPDLSAPESCLVGLDYVVFGLGNRQYDHFNAMGKFFDHALERLGGNRLLALGLGDDDDDIERDFESWKDNHLWPLLEKLYLPNTSVLKERKTKKPALPDCPYVVEFLDDRASKPDHIPLDKVHGLCRHYFTAVPCPVDVVRELRSPMDTGSTVHIELDISRCEGLTYKTADNLGVLPLNSDDVVESVAAALNYDLDAFFRVKAAPNHEWHGAPFPMPLSIRECLTRYCDLTQAPRRSDLKRLVAYAKEAVDQKALLRMSSKEGRHEYKEKIVDGLVGMVDLLRLCPSIHMPLEHFLNAITPLQTRFFTISSSSSVFPKCIHLTVSVTEDIRPDGTIFKGVCSNYMKELESKKTCLRVHHRPSTFRLPLDVSRPILMIGPGTGIAPMRALLQERSFQRKIQKKDVGRNVLYFGCKLPTQDYIYEEELQAFKVAGDLAELHVAFSRQTATKLYVQHLLKQNATDVWKLLSEEGGHLYVCGGVKMGVEIQDTIRQIAADEGGLVPEAAKKYVTKMMLESRYVQELWS